MAGVLRKRFAKYGLELHEEKTRLITFGRFAEENLRRQGQGKPPTFDFLGFTHICGAPGKACAHGRRWHISEIGQSNPPGANPVRPTLSQQAGSESCVVHGQP